MKYLIFILLLSTPVFAQTICDTVYGPYTKGCYNYDPGMDTQKDRNCDLSSPYAEFNLGCYDEYDPRLETQIPPYDPNYPLPFTTYYRGFGRDVSVVNKDLAIEHYKACRANLGDVLASCGLD